MATKATGSSDLPGGKRLQLALLEAIFCLGGQKRAALQDLVTTVDLISLLSFNTCLAFLNSRFCIFFLNPLCWNDATNIPIL